MLIFIGHALRSTRGGLLTSRGGGRRAQAGSTAKALRLRGCEGMAFRLRGFLLLAVLLLHGLPKAGFAPRL